MRNNHNPFQKSMETIKKTQEKFNYEEFEKNLRLQREELRQYYGRHNDQKFPFDESGYHEFWHQYWYFRACLASFQQNPDTKDDEDFVALCDYWKSRSGSPFQLRQKDFDELERRYRELEGKPAFGANPLYNQLFGSFVKGIYAFITGACPAYWDGFFDID